MANIFIRPRAGIGRLLAYLVLFVGAALALNAWIFSTGAIEWARGLENPSWAPTGPVIGAVWVGLFALMAGSIWSVDRFAEQMRKDPARAGILLQYIVNMSWTFAYFGLQNVANGFYVTVIAWVLCLGVLIVVFRASRIAGALLAPLLGWLSFALVLSWTTWRLNL